MPQYQYKALTKEGKKFNGIYNSTDREAVLRMLADREAFPIFVKEKEFKDIREIKILARVNTKDIAVFCRQFYSMLNAGVPIVNCLNILRQQTENKKLEEVLSEVYEEVNKGETFSDILKKYPKIFPELLIYMVEAGEVSGNLDVVMERMANHYEKEVKINNKIKAATFYPIILSIVATIVVIVLLVFVMPTFVGMFQGAGVQLPLPTRILIAISDAIKSFWYIFIAAGFGMFYFFKAYASTEKGRYNIDSIKLKLPILKPLAQKVATTRFARTVATLLSSGIPLLKALETVSGVVGNRVYSVAIMDIRKVVSDGAELSTPITRNKIFPPMLGNMIRIGEESGTLDDVLERTALFYDEEVDVAIDKLTTVLEPLMIVVMAVVIGGIVIAMILPMFDMMQLV
ncbi:MAG: type II secretion system F family protein [Alkaliphilus sp.]